jgi:alanine dehydrogenase
MKKIGILREEKQPVDNRAPLTPDDCRKIISTYNYKIYVQHSQERCFTDAEYKEAGAEIQENLFECDIIRYPPEFDGHTSQDVIKRLKDLIDVKDRR